MEPEVRAKIVMKKLGAEIKHAERKLQGMTEYLEMALSGITKVLEDMKSVREEVAAFEKTRRSIENEIKNMEEQAMLEESFREEFVFEEEESEESGAIGKLQEGGDVRHSGEVGKEMKEMEKAEKLEKRVKEDIAFEENKFTQREEVEERTEMARTDDEMEVTDEFNNYRGVCLLTMGSRILAKVLTNRLRLDRNNWSIRGKSAGI